MKALGTGIAIGVGVSLGMPLGALLMNVGILVIRMALYYLGVG